MTKVIVSNIEDEIELKDAEVIRIQLKNGVHYLIELNKDSMLFIKVTRTDPNQLDVKMLGGKTIELQ